MSNIEDLKRKQKALEYNKKQLEEQLENVTSEIERLKNKRYHLNIAGGVSEIPTFYSESSILAMAKYGNVFFSIEEAEKESEKRRLMYEIEEFRNERNDGWSPNWEHEHEGKYSLFVERKGVKRVGVFVSYYSNHIPIFGYFKNRSDAQRAVEIFGERILKLYNE